MARSNTQLTASAGEHFVAYKLSRLGCIVALVRQGSQAIDILVSTVDGSHTVGLQVKTTFRAERTRGRGAKKAPADLQFPLGHHAVEAVSENVIFCFVDLRSYVPEADLMPDVYIIPARELRAEYKDQDIHKYSWLRHHRPIAHMAKYKNKWTTILQALSDQKA
jgi:hypothetical protein